MKIRRYIIEEIDEEDLPKSVAKMKKNKQKREEENISRKNRHLEEPQKKKSSHKKSKNGEEEPEKPPKKKSKIKKILKIIVLIILLILIFNLIISTIRWRKLAKDMLTSKFSTVLDSQGNTIAQIGDSKVKTTISSDEIPEDLKNAYISIEDERFYKHHGVDGKRTIAAAGSYIIHFGSSSFGGSTITQQLVKNMTGDSSNSITRKIKEWWKAWNLESCADKDEIITSYLNTIYVGPNIYGVEAGAHYYFSKSAKDLNLAECAFLAGINHSPNSYNPFDDSNLEKITKRTKTVLNKMKELEQISTSEYDEAIKIIEQGLNFQKETQESGTGVYSYHTDALINETIEDLSKRYKISKTFATNYLELSGATIYSTQNTSIQSQIEEEFEKEKYQIASNVGGDPSQAAMVIINHETGEVLGCVGGLGEKTSARPLNRATQSVRQTGSSIKPIAVVAPAIDKKIITAASIVDDTERDFSGGYHPIDYTTPLGKITVRRAIESSQNVPFVEIMEELTPKTSIKYLKKMGITTLTEKDESLALALGGLDKGISPLEMAGAYATIANNGQYIEPTFYTEIKRNNGKTLLKTKQTKKKVFSEEVAYIMQELLTQPIVGSHGTATYCGITGIDIAAKTGTTDDNYDRWLCGFSPYYTCVCWYGYDQSESINYNNRNPSGLLWANVMSKIHTGLQGKRFEKPDKVVELTICAETGKKATTGCPDRYQEYFLKGTEPDLCDSHIGSEIINSSSAEEKVETIQSPTTEITAPEEENRNTIPIESSPATPPTTTPSPSESTSAPENTVTTPTEPSLDPLATTSPSASQPVTKPEEESEEEKDIENTN